MSADVRRVLVVDDEPLARQRLLRWLDEWQRARTPDQPRLEIASACDGLEARDVIARLQPDVLLLDIEMPGLGGFDLLRQLDARPLRVIFTTAYDAYAVAAFESEACDYLVKPFTHERFRAALQRALASVADARRLAALEVRLAAHDAAPRLAVHHGGHLRWLDVDTIEYAVSRAHVSCVRFAGGHEALCDLSIATLARRLDPRRFVSLHRGSLVNVQQVVALRRARDGRLWLELRSGQRLPVARRRHSEARALWRDSE